MAQHDHKVVSVKAQIPAQRHNRMPLTEDQVSQRAFVCVHSASLGLALIPQQEGRVCDGSGKATRRWGREIQTMASPGAVSPLKVTQPHDLSAAFETHVVVPPACSPISESSLCGCRR